MEQIRHYKIIEKLGSGGMGTVYKAFDSVLERDVAIKVMHRHLLDDEKNAARFMQEARAAAKLVHPNVVTIHEVGEAECGRYIVMEYIHGVPLTHLLTAEGTVKPERVIKLTIQILKGLHCAHGLKILHRDIKTDNILVTRDDIVKILDFGIAKITTKHGLTGAGDVLGTVKYMAPEQMLGEVVDHRCDIYSAGVVLYQLLTNRLPFTGESPVEIIYKQLNEDPIPPSFYNKEIGEQLDQIVLKAINKRREDRWETAEVFGRVLEAIFALHTSPAVCLDTGASMSELQAEVELKPETSNKLRTVFVGREKEFKKLVHLLSRALNAQGQTVIVAGEAGVGKTRLVTRLWNYAEHNHAWVLYGACMYQEGMNAYLPYIDALRDFFSRKSCGMSEDELRKLKEMVREKVPLLLEFTESFATTSFRKTSDAGTADDADKANLFEGLHLLFSLLSTMQPLVLIVDDLQWADEASLRLFHYLSRHISGNRILLLGISRTDRYDLQSNGKPAMLVDMLSRMRREDHCEQITLDRLSRENCDLLIDQSLSSTMFSEEFYERIYRETKGNPFFVLETLKLLCENGGIFFEEGAWCDKPDGLKLEVPNRVEDIFARRLNGLGDEEREILQVAAVIGYKFDASLLAQLLQMPKIKLLKMLQRLEQDAQILSSSEKGFQFEHPMLQELLCNEIPVALRQEYHLMIASELEKIHGSAWLGEIAQHFRRGGDHVKAVPLLYQAGLRTFGLSAYWEASSFFEDCLDSSLRTGLPMPESIVPTEFHLKLGICYEETGRWAQSLEAYKKLLELSEQAEQPQGQVDALRRLGRIHCKLGEWETGLMTYERSLQIAEQHRVPNALSRIYNGIGLIYFEKGDIDQALRYFKQTLQTIDSEAGEYDKAHVLTNIGIIANIRGDHRAALENYQNALVIYEKKSDRQGLARVYHNMGMTYSDMGKWAQSIDAFEHCLKLTDEVEDKHLRALTYLNLGKAYGRQKNLPAAKRFAEKALKIFKRMGDVLSVAEVYHVFGLIHAARGNLAVSERFLKESIRLNEQKNYQEGLSEACLSYGNLCRDHGQIERAIEYYKQAAAAFSKLTLDNKAKDLAKVIDELGQKSDPEVRMVNFGLEQNLQPQPYEQNSCAG